MLNKLLPDQVSKFWDVIKYAIEESLPPTVGQHRDKMNRILSSCLSGDLEVWAAYERNGEDVKFEGIMITTFVYDTASNTKSLLIYCVYGYTQVSPDTWAEGIEAIGKYAKANKCHRVVAYSDIPYMIEKAKLLGADTKYTFLSFPI